MCLKYPLHMPMAAIADDATLKTMEQNGQIIFKYCNEHGDITADANPNGSLLNIAGVCNTAKNVFGMMPHPDRADDKQLGNTDGLKIMRSIVSTTLDSYALLHTTR